jgi:WD repeat-containing protein 6
MQMRNELITTGVCLPVTALHVVNVDGVCVLLVVQGPFLHIHDLKTGNRLLTQRTFDVQTIHGICHTGPCYDDSTRFTIPVVLIGGSSIAFVSLTLQARDCVVTGCNADVNAFHEASDWILKVHCHDFGCGSEGFIFLSADNTLYRTTSSTTSVIPDSVTKWIKGPKSALYSGDISSHHTDCVLVASGSVFGEVLVWTCEKVGETSGDWTTRTTHRFQGHSGSIFGVSISQEFPVEGNNVRLVASCSDDRTIQGWDLSAHEAKESKIPHSGDSRDTGFGHDRTNDHAQVARVSGHLSRIWGVDFVIKGSRSDCQKIFLVSRGEDATCKLWDLEPTRKAACRARMGSLSLRSSDRHHSGKNILAWAHYQHEQSTTLVSGGADGRIVKRPLVFGGPSNERTVACSFHDIPISAGSRTLKDYLILESSKVLALTASGRLLRSSIGETDGSWESLAVPCLSSVSRLGSNVMHRVFVFATTDGIWVSDLRQVPVFVPIRFPHPVAWMRIVSVDETVNQGLQMRLVITFPSSETAMFVQFDTAYIDYAPEITTVKIARGFVTTTACYDVKRNLLFLGSRSGALALYTGLRSNPHQSPFKTLQVHGTDAVTSLQVIDSYHDQSLHILSTGRDGTYSAHEVNPLSGSGDYSFRTLYRMSPPFVVSIEGATITQPGSDRQELTLFGFRSKDFVVWNQTNQTQILSVPCGGAHRNWAYEYEPATREHAFVWTRASTFNYLRSMGTATTILARGGHGREIKALAVRHSANGKVVIATGAEDTTIRLFSVQPSAGADCFRPLTVLSGHTTGVQHLAFSSCGQYLFSSGGSGELFGWRVNDNAPLVGIGVTLLDRMAQAKDDLDARILSFDVMDPAASRAASPNDRAIRIVAAYSNGKVREIEYRQDADGIPGNGIFEPKTEIIYGTFCLMEVHLCQSSITQQITLMAAGSNGRINRSSLPPTPNSLPAHTGIETHAIHQDSILTLDSLDLVSTGTLVVTGGDDNALGLTIAFPATGGEPEAAEGNPGTTAFRSILVPKAHAAALTALKIIYHEERSGEQGLVVVSAGNDQRVKVWGITINLRDLDEDRDSWHARSLESVRIVKLYERWTCVADLSDIGLLGAPETVGEEMRFEMVVVGVGMEALRLSVDREALWREEES